MTEKQKLFCDEYLKDTNATRAYLAVYANCKSAISAAPLASKLLKKKRYKSISLKRWKKSIMRTPQIFEK